MFNVHTVLGPIAPEALGPCSAHEHLLLATPLLPAEELDDVDSAIEDARALRAAGAAALVEWTPLGLGRDLDGLAAISRASGLQVVACTGLHREAHYPEGFPGSVENLGDLFAGELADRCGAIKTGAGYHRISDFEQRTFEAAAAAHARTGAPVCVHTEQGTLGPELLELLTGLGVPADRIVLAHLDRNPDSGLHRELAEAGAWLCYDRIGRIKYGPDSEILALIEAVGPERLLLGGDHARRSEAPLDYVFRRFVPRLDPGVAQRLLVENPAEAFAW